jgi:hypothetical protein
VARLAVGVVVLDIDGRAGPVVLAHRLKRAVVVHTDRCR